MLTLKLWRNHVNQQRDHLRWISSYAVQIQILLFRHRSEFKHDNLKTSPVNSQVWTTGGFEQHWNIPVNGVEHVYSRLLVSPWGGKPQGPTSSKLAIYIIRAPPASSLLGKHRSEITVSMTISFHLQNGRVVCLSDSSDHRYYHSRNIMMYYHCRDSINIYEWSDLYLN